MDMQTKIRRYKAVKELYERINGCKSWFFSPGDLQGFGIQALQVDVSDEGSLQFDPCFFRPYPERDLPKYPLDTVRMATVGIEKIRPLNFRPDFDSILRDYENTPGIEDPLRSARSRYESIMELTGPDEWAVHATETYMHIQSQLDACRIGLSPYSSFAYLSSLGRWRTKPTRGDPPTVVGGNRDISWRIESWQEDGHESLPNPHAIAALTSDVPANREDGNLTRHEITAILAIMVIRTRHRPFVSHPIHPLLLISYTGQKHGRIIQASLHGDQLLLQYSQLWSFADDETAPVDLFMRYSISQLVEIARVEKPNVALGSLVGPIASMNLD
ncbi:uncharacterized protein N7482_005971 [Penicillium canariense]|uniref:Uncharacterized protein n=1 Tax=Penicillium canariense TaxID=189055 RepID=A0A9W9I3E5_9EURO|nr:uncharacterized protein N7482_005971 [Penicillium canariense]KAJ5167190.1 hypothetical protein N7482_005971 [Penicillium canariense]